MSPARARSDHARHVALADGTRLYLRRVREADLRRSQVFFQALSPRSRYLRLLQQTPRLPPSVLSQLRSQLKDPRCHVIAALVAHDDGDEIVGGGRIVPTARRNACEFALTVIDVWQGRGVGRAVLDELIHAARLLGYTRAEGYVLPSNTGMLALGRRSRMQVEGMPEDPQLMRLSRRVLPRAGLRTGG